MSPTNDIEKRDGDLADAPKRACDPHHLRSPSIAEGEFPPHNEQSLSEEDLIDDQARAHHPLDTTLRNEALFARWIRRRRAALRHAIAERQAAKALHHHTVRAEQLGRELHSASERVLLAFSDVDVSIVQHRAEEFERAATGSPLPDLDLPDNLVARRTMRDEARKQVATATATHESLVADLSQAESAVRQATQKVANAAIDVLIAEGVKRATALKAAWNEVWRQYDQLCALTNCQLHCAEASFPIILPPDIVTLLQTIAALDDRELADGRNDAAASAGEVWCRWFETLLTDAEAEVTFETISAMPRSTRPRSIGDKEQLNQLRQVLHECENILWG